MLKLHKLFRYSKHVFGKAREGLLSVWKFTIVYYLLKYSNISGQTHMCPPHRTPIHAEAQEKKYIFFDDFVSATTECHPYPG